MNFQSISVFHFELLRTSQPRLRASLTIKLVNKWLTDCLWAICQANPCAFKQEAKGGWRFALSLTECVHELLQLGGPLDLEEDLIVIIGNFDIQVLGST